MISIYYLGFLSIASGSMVIAAIIQTKIYLEIRKLVK